MSDYLFTRGLVGAATNLAQTGWGQRLFRNPTTNHFFQAMLRKGLLHFLRRDDPALVRMMADVAVITSELVTRVYSQDRPGSVKRAFSSMIRGMASVGYRDRMRTEHGVGPNFYVLNPTQRCNLSCWGCYDACRSEGPSLSLDIMDYIVSEMKADFGIHFVVVSGGEPFMSEDLLKLAALHPDVVFMPYTNGTKIDGAVIAELARLGNVSPAISLEGAEAFTDGRRGKGHFQKMMEMIAALREAGIIYGFSATCTRENAAYLASRKFFQWCIDQGYLYGWLFQYIPIGRNPDLDLMATPEQRFALGALVHQMRAEHWPIFIADFWNDGQLVDGCIAAGRHYFQIDAFGFIKPCVFTPVRIRDTVHLIKAGGGIYRTIADAISRDPLMVAFRENQEILREGGHHIHRPCSVIDHPSFFRALCRSPYATPLISDRCPASMLEENGEIALGLDVYAAAYGRLIEEKTDASHLAAVT